MRNFWPKFIHQIRFYRLKFNCRIIFFFIATFLIIPLHISTNVFCQNGKDQPTEEPPKIGLALSGGGARGIAHIGVIIALEEEGIPIDLIAGTSMGSIVGGLYAAGYNGEAQRKLVSQINWKDIFSQAPEPSAVWVSKRYGLMEPIFRLHFKFWEIFFPFGLINGQHISEELFRLTAAADFAAKSNFDNLLVPYRAVAVDISNGEVFAIGKGCLAQAIHSSTAIPLYFYPVLFEDKLMVDGGVINVLPTDVVRQLGADVVIAVDVKEMFPIGKLPENFVDIANQTIDIMVQELEKENMKLADVFIMPDLGNHSSKKYSGFDTLIKQGYLATKEKMAEIKKVIAKRIKNSNRFQRQLDKSALEKAIVSRIKVIGHEISEVDSAPDKGKISGVKELDPKLVQTKAITKYFRLKEGNLFKLESALQGVENLYATGLYQNIWLELDNLENGHVGMNIHFIEESKRTIGFGANYRNEEGMSGFVKIVPFNIFGLGDQFMPLFRYGKIQKKAGLEISIDSFFATPFTLNTGINYEKERPYLYDNAGKNFGQLEMDRRVGQFSLGLKLKKKFLFTLGLRAERVGLGEDLKIKQPDMTLKYWSTFGQLLFDNTDNRYFPTKGIHLFIEYQTVIGINRQDHKFTKFLADFYWTNSILWKQILTSYLKVGISNNRLPIYERFRLGGPLNLPGYHRDELWGNYLLIFGLSHRLKIFKGLSLQTTWSLANVFDDHKNIKSKNFINGISTGLTFPSPIGPIAISYGWSDKNRNQLYVSIGYDF
jgi:NTE family protein